MSAPQLLWFGIASVLKILNNMLTKLINKESMSDKGVYRTALATPGLLNTVTDLHLEVFKLVSRVASLH